METYDYCHECDTFTDYIVDKELYARGSNFDLITEIYGCQCLKVRAKSVVRKYHDPNYVENSASSPSRHET